MASQQELVEQLNNLRIEVSRLKNSLDELDKEKESWFKKKEEFSSKIRASIQKIKENKAKRDLLTHEVKDLKPKRDGINKGLAEKSRSLGNLKKEKSDLIASFHIKESPFRIKQQIEKLEFKIETDMVSFEKEKELMKKIKGLKKQYSDSSVIIELNKKINAAFDGIKKMRKDANELHKSIQEKAKQSQVLHEEILKISAEIDKARVEEEASFKKFSEFKKQFTEANNQLKEKLKEMNHVKSQLDKIHFDRKERKRQQQESFLKSKEDAVNEKIRKGQKLTTEDLLVFQKFGKE